MFRSVLVANRGEIARRVFATARRMGIETVAVFSEADASAAHVADADRAVLIGPAAARESYLVPEKIIEAARVTGAEAIHPGYGFLSENADFAQGDIQAVEVGVEQALRRLGRLVALAFQPAHQQGHMHRIELESAEHGVRRAEVGVERRLARLLDGAAVEGLSGEDRGPRLEQGFEHWNLAPHFRPLRGH